MANAKDFTFTVDGGHGLKPQPTAGKRTQPIPELNNRVVYEREFNEAAKDFFIEGAKRIGFKVVDVAPELEDISLSTRVRRANAAGGDIHVSFHYNALSGKWGNHGGIETLAGSSQASKAAAAKVQKHLVNDTKFRDRGVKDGSWLGLNKVNSPLVLVECGFMDNKQEALRMILTAHQKACAEATLKGLCEHFGVKYVAPSAPQPTPEKPEASKPAPVDYSRGIGMVEVLTDNVPYRVAKDFSSKVLYELEKGQRFYVYAKDGYWHDLGIGWASSGARNEMLKFIPHPEQPKPAPKPPAPKADIYRVFVDGKQIGAFSKGDNILEEAEKAIKAGAKDVKIERV